MSISWGARGKASAEINVTPLIDVLLVLLIIFMVVLPHHRLGEPAEIPAPGTDAKPSRPDSIVIQVLSANDGRLPELQINSTRVAWQDLGERLNEIFQSRSERVAFLQGDPEVDFQYMADALDIAHRAGVDQVGLMSESSTKGKLKH